LQTRGHRTFRFVWWSCNLLLATAFVAMLYSCVREYSVRRYLDGFSDAIVPNALPAEQKVEAILNWMRAEPSRADTTNPEALAGRDPEMTLTYRQLLNVCGTATNAFLNLARSSDLRVRRLLLLSPDRRTKHVVAEALIDKRWIVIDPTYRVIMQDARGHYLTRSELRDPAVFSEAVRALTTSSHMYGWRVCLSKSCICGACWTAFTLDGMNRWTGACSWNANLSSIWCSPRERQFSFCRCGSCLPGMGTAV